MDSSSNQPQTIFDDQELLAIINELNANVNHFDNPRVSELKDLVHDQGLEFALKICSLAVENDAHQYVKYILFSNISELLHPRSPPEFLLEIINQFTQIISKETARVTKIALCRCIANAFYHLVSEENIQEFITLFQSLEDSSIYFLYELVNILHKSLDIPMLASKNFLIIVNILPELLPISISCFFNNPEIYEYDIISFYLTTLTQPPLEILISKISTEISFSVENFIEQIRKIIESNILEIVEVFKNPALQEQENSDYLIYLINFFSMTVSYGIDSQIASQILDSILTIKIDSNNIECFCDMIKKLFKTIPDIVTSELIGFLIEMAIECATQFNLGNLNKILNVISYIFTLLIENEDPEAQNSIFPQLTEQILPLVIRQYPDKTIENDSILPVRIISMNGENSNRVGQNNNEIEDDDDDESEDDDDDEYQIDLTNREQIIEFLVYFSIKNPLPSLSLVGEIFFNLISTNQANYYVCEWVLGLLYTFLQFCENEIDNISKVISEVVMTPIVVQNVQENGNIENLILDIYKTIEDKQMALSAFHLAICQFADNDEIMEKAIEIANIYKFSLIEEIPFDSPLSLKILTTLAYNSPSPVIFDRIDKLMQTNDTNKMQEATALLKGLQKAKDESDFPFEIDNYTIHLTENQMFAEALEINYCNPEICIQIVDLATQKTYDDKIFDLIALKALKAASENCIGLLTEKVLILVNIGQQLSDEMNFLILDLFLKHKEKIKENPEKNEHFLTEASFVFLVNFARSLFDAHIIPYKLTSKVFESFIFYFEQVLQLIDNDFWIIIIRYYLWNNMEVVMNCQDGYDLLFQLMLVNFEVYRSMLLDILSEATDNSEELFDYLHNDIDKDTQEMRSLYQNRFYCVYKAFDYYRHFT